MKSSLIFLKALLQLDRGKYEEGEATLKMAIEQAESKGNIITQISALVCLGDLLQNKDAAPKRFLCWKRLSL